MYNKVIEILSFQWRPFWKFKMAVTIVARSRVFISYLILTIKKLSIHKISCFYDNLNNSGVWCPLTALLMVTPGLTTSYDYLRWVDFGVSGIIVRRCTTPQWSGVLGWRLGGFGHVQKPGYDSRDCRVSYDVVTIHTTFRHVLSRYFMMCEGHRVKFEISSAMVTPGLKTAYDHLRWAKLGWSWTIGGESCIIVRCYTKSPPSRGVARRLGFFWSCSKTCLRCTTSSTRL